MFFLKQCKILMLQNNLRSKRGHQQDHLFLFDYHICSQHLKLGLKSYKIDMIFLELSAEDDLRGLTAREKKPLCGVVALSLFPHCHLFSTGAARINEKVKVPCRGFNVSIHV